MHKPDDATRNSGSINCYAMIVYKQPDWFTALEQATFDHGTHADRIQVLTTVCMRGLGIPSRLVESGDTNYSSSRLDHEQYKRRIGGTSG